MTLCFLQHQFSTSRLLVVFCMSWWVALPGPDALREGANMLSVVLEPAAAIAAMAKAAYPYTVPTMQVCRMWQNLAGALPTQAKLSCGHSWWGCDSPRHT
jgi:hypothetical protein